MSEARHILLKTCLLLIAITIPVISLAAEDADPTKVSTKNTEFNEKLHKDETAMRTECSKDKKGVRKIVKSSSAGYAVKFECSSDTDDYCFYEPFGGKEELIPCYKDPTLSREEQLKLWAREMSSDIAQRLLGGVNASNRAYFTDPAGLIAERSPYEPPLPSNGSRAVEINSIGLNEALSGLPERVEAFGREALSRGLTLDDFQDVSNFGINPIVKPFPHTPPPPDSESREGVVIPFREYGDTGLSVMHLQPFDAAPGPETEPGNRNMFLRDGPLVYDEYGKYKYYGPTFPEHQYFATPLLRGTPPYEIADVPMQYEEGDQYFTPIIQAPQKSFFARAFEWVGDKLGTWWKFLSGG